MTAKRELRRALLARRDGLDVADRRRWSQLIVDRVLTDAFVAGANTVASYVSFGSEVDTGGINSSLSADGRLVVPRVRGLELDFVPVDGTTEFTISDLGVSEPTGPPVDLATIDVILVPGVAFDREGIRLGYGGGFYDRLLAELDRPTLGLCFADLHVDELPREPHDQPVDVVVTNGSVAF